VLQRNAIFLSHRHADAARARELSRLLGERGFSCACSSDRDSLPAGADWEAWIYGQLSGAQALVALHGPGYYESAWSFAELVLARSLGHVVIPLGLTSTPPVGLLARAQGIEWTLDDESWLDALVAALEDAEARTGLIEPGRSPYPGLAAFEEEDEAFFVGRSDLRREVERRLRRSLELRHNAVVVVTGASGSGKSSLMLAGVLPRARREGYRIFGPCRPSKGLATMLAQLGEAGASGAPAILVVDQLEELFGAATESAPLEFFARIAAIRGNDDGRSVLLTAVRSDFLGDLELAASAAGLDVDGIVVQPFAASDLVDVINEPARRIGMKVEPGLSAELLHDLGASGSIPLLAFALRRVWQEARESGTMSVDSYGAIGRLSGCLSDAADAALASAQRELGGSRRAVRSELAKLIDRAAALDEGRRWIRRRVPTSALSAKEQVVAAALAEQRLMIPSEGSVEVAHEALFEDWPTMRDHLEKARVHHDIARHVRRDCADWNEAGRPRSLLLRGTKLSRAFELTPESRDRLLTPEERSFVRDSGMHRTAVWSGLAACALVLTWIGWWLADRIGESSTADRLVHQARVARRTDPHAALKTVADCVERFHNRAARTLLIDMLWMLSRFESVDDVTDVLWNDDGTVVAVGRDGANRLLDRKWTPEDETPRPTIRLASTPDEPATVRSGGVERWQLPLGVEGAEESPNGRWVAAWTEDDVLLFDSEGTKRSSFQVTAIRAAPSNTGVVAVWDGADVVFLRDSAPPTTWQHGETLNTNDYGHEIGPFTVRDFAWSVGDFVAVELSLDEGTPVLMTNLVPVAVVRDDGRTMTAYTYCRYAWSSARPDIACSFGWSTSIDRFGDRELEQSIRTDFSLYSDWTSEADPDESPTPEWSADGSALAVHGGAVAFWRSDWLQTWNYRAEEFYHSPGYPDVILDPKGRYALIQYFGGWELLRFDTQKAETAVPWGPDFVGTIRVSPTGREIALIDRQIGAALFRTLIDETWIEKGGGKSPDEAMWMTRDEELGDHTIWTSGDDVWAELPLSAHARWVEGSDRTVELSGGLLLRMTDEALVDAARRVWGLDHWAIATGN